MTAIQTAAVAPLKVYIAGKITGDPEVQAQVSFRAHGAEERGTHSAEPAHLPEGWKSADYMRICLAMNDSADLSLSCRGGSHPPGRGSSMNTAAIQASG